MHVPVRCFALSVALSLLAAVLPSAVEAAPEDSPQGGVQTDGAPPSITYPGSRSSRKWITQPNGTRVAVGQGVEWKGVKVYLSLLWDLIGVDAKTDKVLYSVNVGAFWNGIGFKEVSDESGVKAWAVELRPGPRTRTGKDRRQHHDLRTGKKLEVPGQAKTPSGKTFKPRAVWSGKHSLVAKPFHLIASTKANWQSVQKRMFGDDVPAAFKPVDFEKEVVLVISSGDAWNCSGISVAAAYEDDKRFLIRTQRHTFQTMNGGQQARPYGIVVLPRHASKAYVVERNTQGLIGGPALWKVSWRLAALRKPTEELEQLPAGSAQRHDKWVK